MKASLKYQNTIFTDNISNKTLSTLQLSLSNSNRFLTLYESKNSAIVKPILYQTLSTHYYNDNPKMAHSLSRRNPSRKVVLRTIESPKQKIHSRHMVDLFDFDYDEKKEMKKLRKERLKLLKAANETPMCTDWTNIRLKEIKTKVKFLNKVVNKMFPHIFISKQKLEENYQKTQQIELKKNTTIDIDSRKVKFCRERSILEKRNFNNKTILLKSSSCFRKIKN